MIKVSKALSKDKKVESPTRSKDISEQKVEFERLEKELQNELICYKHTLDMKNVSRNPELILVFNSEKKVLKFPGFPMLMKEIAEILECGRLSEYRVVEYVECIERYS